MATRTLAVDGQLSATPASMTITVDSTQIFSGACNDVPVDTDAILASGTYDDGGVVGEATIAVTVSVTAGIVKIGQLLSDPLGYDSLNAAGQAEVDPDLTTTDPKYYNNGKEYRSNILINGSAPVFPDAIPSDVEVADPGTAENPDWRGWRFEISAGETFSCNVTVPATLA